MENDEKVVIQRIPNEKIKVIISKRSTINSYTIKLRFPLINVVNIKLIKAVLTHDNSLTNNIGPVILHIDEFDRINSGKENNNYENSFAVLDLNNIYNNGNTTMNIYTNTYEENNDIIYYCPPVSLSDLKIKLFNDTEPINYENVLKLELEVEMLSDRRT